ncbi:hypothetical protein GCM10007147_45540 [Nocardiopsis kunsanensis]|uniref:Uncharacterized protein n=1 Tax=Nocardiopsis kunsanensis TaxID=141693 RepID=A0A918XM99_9ACTN|nr:hypothetical protein GCM10007147_45540 [Nocardiopsis kunsanensis]
MLPALLLSLSPVAPAPQAAAEPVPVDPYEDCPEVIYYTVPGGAGGLFEIAENVLGEPERAAEIYTHTEGRTQPDGGMLTSDQEVRPGWHLIMPWDAAGENVLKGQDPLCVIEVDEALAQGQTPPEPAEAPPSPEPTPSPEASDGPSDETSDGSSGGLLGGRGSSNAPDIDPKILGIGAGILLTLTIFALFWKPIFKGVAWPFKKIAALPWRRPRPPRFVRSLRRRKRRDAAGDVIAADPGAEKRANIAYLELRSAPAEVPARPVAVFTADREITVMVSADATPPASSWEVVEPTLWRHTTSRSATSAVRFDTTSRTELGMVNRGLLLGIGVVEAFEPEEGQQQLLFVDFTALRGVLAVNGHREMARETVRVVAEALGRAGVRTRAPGKPLDRLFGEQKAPESDDGPIRAWSGEGRPKYALILERPLERSEVETLGRIPQDVMVVALGRVSGAHWQWEAHEDGTVSTGPLGVNPVLRPTQEQMAERAEKLAKKRGKKARPREDGPVTERRGRREPDPRARQRRPDGDRGRPDPRDRERQGRQRRPAHL